MTVGWWDLDCHVALRVAHRRVRFGFARMARESAGSPRASWQPVPAVVLPPLTLAPITWDESPDPIELPPMVAVQLREGDEARVARNGAALIARDGSNSGLARITAGGACHEVIDPTTTEFPHVGGVAIAPDGTWGLFAEERGTRLRRIDVETGAVADVAQLDRGCVASVILDDAQVALWLEAALVIATVTVDGGLRRVASLGLDRGVFSCWRGRVFLCGGNGASITLVGWAHGVLAPLGVIEAGDEPLRHLVERDRAVVWHDGGVWELGGLDGAWARFSGWARTQAARAGVRAAPSTESFALRTLITGGPRELVDWHPGSRRSIGIRNVSAERVEVLAGVTDDLKPLEPVLSGAHVNWQFRRDGEAALVVVDGQVARLDLSRRPVVAEPVAATHGVSACWLADGFATVAAPAPGQAVGALVLHRGGARIRLPLLVSRESWEDDGVAIGSACGGDVVAISSASCTILVAVAGGRAHGIGVLERGGLWQSRDRDGALYLAGDGGATLRVDGLAAAHAAAVAQPPLERIERTGLPVIAMAAAAGFPGAVTLRAVARQDR